jgi:hypothetical protein
MNSARTCGGGSEASAARSLPTIYVDAYIAATRLEIEDDTQIVLKYPNRFLFLIASEIRVGKNVTITWDRSLNNAPDPPNAPEKRQTAASPVLDDGRTPGLWGIAGEAGIDGAKSYEDDPARTAKGYHDGTDGPEVELWTLSLQGRPIIDVQDRTEPGVVPGARVGTVGMGLLGPMQCQIPCGGGNALGATVQVAMVVMGAEVTMEELGETVATGPVPYICTTSRCYDIRSRLFGERGWRTQGPGRAR